MCLSSTLDPRIEIARRGFVQIFSDSRGSRMGPVQNFAPKFLGEVPVHRYVCDSVHVLFVSSARIFQMRMASGEPNVAFIGNTPDAYCRESPVHTLISDETPHL